LIACLFNQPTVVCLAFLSLGTSCLISIDVGVDCGQKMQDSVHTSPLHTIEFADEEIVKYEYVFGPSKFTFSFFTLPFTREARPMERDHLHEATY
jgi:hypothetical protein